jgi:hypothetical protein
LLLAVCVTAGGVSPHPGPVIPPGPHPPNIRTLLSQSRGREGTDPPQFGVNPLSAAAPAFRRNFTGSLSPIFFLVAIVVACMFAGPASAVSSTNSATVTRSRSATPSVAPSPSVYPPLFSMRNVWQLSDPRGVLPRDVTLDGKPDGACVRRSSLWPSSSALSPHAHHDPLAPTSARHPFAAMTSVCVPNLPLPSPLLRLLIRCSGLPEKQWRGWLYQCAGVQCPKRHVRGGS